MASHVEARLRLIERLLHRHLSAALAEEREKINGSLVDDRGAPAIPAEVYGRAMTQLDAEQSEIDKLMIAQNIPTRPGPP